MLKALHKYHPSKFHLVVKKILPSLGIHCKSFASSAAGEQCIQAQNHNDFFHYQDVS
jgi:hypothetical protein